MVVLGFAGAGQCFVNPKFKYSWFVLGFFGAGQCFVNPGGGQAYKGHTYLGELMVSKAAKLEPL